MKAKNRTFFFTFIYFFQSLAFAHSGDFDLARNLELMIDSTSKFEFRWPNPKSDCNSFSSGELLGDSIFTVVGKSQGEQLRNDARPSDLIEISREFLNPNLIDSMARASIRIPDSYLYRFVIRSEVYDSFLKMVNEARRHGLEILIYSAYRSFEDQCYVYGEKLRRGNPERVKMMSAYPGRSEHQLGTTFDLTTSSVNYTIEASFESTAEFKWLKSHAHEYGFVMSFSKGVGPEGFNERTGYAYEPWHWRYIGIDAATDFWNQQQQSKITLIDFLRSLKLKQERVGMP